MGAGAGWWGEPLPALDQGRFDVEMIQSSAYGLVDDVIYFLRFVIKGRHGRGDDAAHFRDRCHVAQVGEVERRFAGQQDQLASLLERNTGCPRHQIVVQANGDGTEGIHGTGRDNHAGS